MSFTSKVWPKNRNNYGRGEVHTYYHEIYSVYKIQFLYSDKSFVNGLLWDSCALHDQPLFKIMNSEREQGEVKKEME